MRQSLRAVAALALVLGVSYASAYPLIWTGITQDCAAVPVGSYGPHESPVPDQKTGLTMKRLGSNVVKMCPGMPHKLQFNFPETRQYLLTSTQGSFVGGEDKCPNRVVSSSAKPSVETDLLLPCDATGSVTISLVSVASPGSKTYKLLRTTAPVNPLSSCPASPCHATTTLPPAALESGSVPEAAALVPAPAPAPTPAPDAAAAAAAAAAPAAPSGPINIWSLLNAGEEKKVPFLGALQALAGGANGGANSGAAAGAVPGLPAIPGLPNLQMPKLDAEALQKLSQINTTAVLQVLKTLGKLVPNPNEVDGATGAPQFDLQSVMDFVHTVGQIMPSPSSQSEVAPDIPTAVLNVMKSMGKVLPSNEGMDFIAILNFLKASGDLIGKLAALRPAAPAS